MTVLLPSGTCWDREPQEKLEIRLCPDGSGQLYVPGLTEFQVQSVEDINKVRSWAGQGWEASTPQQSGSARRDRAPIRALHWVRRPLGTCFLRGGGGG